MMERTYKVCVYIFDMEDCRKPQERLETAVREYCRECSMEDVLQRVDAVDRFGGEGSAAYAAENAQGGLLRVERTETGKPYFPNCSRIHFSISHSGVYWACAVAGETIGLDLQEHTLAKGEGREEAAARFRKMAHRFFHSQEAKFVELDCYNNFFTVWAAREAYVKYTGQGIDKYFSEYCVVPEESMWQQVFGQAEAKMLGYCAASEKEKQHPLTSAQTGEVIWQALQKWFWKTAFEESYTLCICTEGICECRIVDKRQ